MGLEKRPIVEAVLVVLLFILVSYVVQVNASVLKVYMGDSVLGMTVYVLITIVAIVIAPISTLPLMPMAAHMWGSLIAAILSIIGWTIGSVIAFLLARHYGARILEKFVSLQGIHRVENMIPQKNMFLSVVFLRMTIPVDILSYALGLFSTMSFRSYFFATLIGVTPFAFVFAYLGGVDVMYQILLLIIVVVVMGVGVIVRKGLKKK